MKSFQHTTPASRTFVGDDCLRMLPAELKRLGCHRVVVFCGASMARHASALARIEQALGPAFAGRFDGVREHSPVPSVEAAADFLEQAGADGAIAVGGGSAVVTTRAATILHAERRPVRALCTQRQADGRLFSPRLEAPKLPNWVIATTPTTGYARAGSALHDPQTGERLALFDPKTRAQGVFVDPVLAATAPASLFASASLNALFMSIEGLESAVDDPLAEAPMRHAVTMLAECLPALARTPDDADLRLRLMLAAMLSGQGTEHAGSGLASVLSHAIGPRVGIANGTIGAVVLPHSMRFNVPVTQPRLARIGAALGVPATGAASTDIDAIVARLAQCLQPLGLPSRLGECGLSVDALDEIAEHALADWFVTRVPRPVTRDDLLQILRDAL